VVEAVRELLANVRGRASVGDELADAEREVEERERELDAAVEAFSVLDDVATVRDRLRTLREERDRARTRLAELETAAAPTLIVSAGDDWDVLTLDEQRSVIRAVLERVTVAPGRGLGRVTVEPRSK
jgi:hypothetical protein